ncbi:MED14-domain-containing protein [Massarina eburnea CBS 473.64]|uniref:Mediator of RNA polymerase II transcription subunit 14 n=1 Tax=Massarina eburnea CBS 473.64 TaxID=1395130 RepID=A0A6A6S2S4_9PLEO|nr:MED14-domain-containing protein [Massarina eburnea CBS 473.64]
MNPTGANGSIAQRDGEARKRSHEGKIVNGPASISDQVAQLPPELVHVAADAYHPLSKLLQRINQECFDQLNEVLQRMASLPVSHQANGALPNGLGSHGGASGGQENAESSKQKKLLMLRFAQANRAKYIKMLVLADWGKKSAGEISKLIDLFAWAKEQCFDQDAVDAQMEQLKLLSAHARQSNPDIRTALEILTTQKAEWLPDLGFVPPEPISSEKALTLLRYMDTSLTIRLTVHEKLPRHLQNWRVESGRATFTIETEFEFDVMSFVEDTSDQWHFIDFRLLFSPAPVLHVDSRIMFELKNIMDHNLAGEGGLEECFHFLHNFTLTHKISVLRSQAHALLQSGWDGSLRVDSPHRQLVLSYWLDKPGKKNWIEIGISRNKPKHGKVSWRGPSFPSLTARWFRQGTEVKDVDLKLDWNNLSAERILKRVISLHTQHLLQTTRQNMKFSTAIKATFSDFEPADCKLEATMGSSANNVTLSVEPASGRYILQPVNLLSAGAENAINRPQDALNPSNVVTQLLARSLLDLVHRCAQQLGWKQIGQRTLRLDVVKTAVKTEVLQFALYSLRGWGSEWAMAVTVDASGQSWWAFKMGTAGNNIKHVEKINMKNSRLDITRGTLAAIARVAVNTLSLYVNTEELRKRGQTYHTSDEFTRPRSTPTSQNVLRGWVLHVKTSELLAVNPGEEEWLQPVMRVVCHGQQLQSQKVWHIATGTMVPNVASDMKKLMASSPQSDFNFSDDGHFQILLNTPFGGEIISKLMSRLRDIDRLRSFATILQKRKMVLQSSSLQQVRFQYGHSLSATVKFEAGDAVKLEFDDQNPHMRVQPFLQNMINAPPIKSSVSGDTTNLDQFCTSLMITRPLLSAIATITDSNTKSFGSPYLLVHTINSYRLAYTNPICSFEIRPTRKDDRVLWVIEDSERNPIDLRPKEQRTPGFTRQENLKAALHGLFVKKEDRWWGVHSGIVAEIDGVREALKELHATVMTCYVEGGVKQPQPLAVNNGNQKQAKAAAPPAPTGKPNGHAPHNQNKAGGPQQRQSFKEGFNKAANKAKAKHDVITID